MKITFLCPTIRISGGVRAILSYADHLAGRGHAVEVVVPGKRRLTTFWRHQRFQAPEWMPDFRARIRWVTRWTPKQLPDGDVLIATAWQTAAPAADAPPRCGKKFYLIQHYESLYHGPSEAVDETYRLPLRKIVISTWLREIMREKFGSEAELLVTPVDPKLFHPVESSVESPRPRVLMMYHWYPWKGVSDGIEAVGRVKQRVSSLHLIGFGVNAPRDGLPYDEYYLNLPQESLAALYSGCDIYLCPSWDEGLGMPSMEAMACGAALVTYDNGGCRDYALDGKTALVARRRDVAHLAEKLELAVSDPELRSKIAREGMAHIQREFSWERAVDTMEALFETGSVHP
jgi:glycosyltransferase involved in cell wall biosynthesis